MIIIIIEYIQCVDFNLFCTNIFLYLYIYYQKIILYSQHYQITLQLFLPH